MKTATNPTSSPVPWFIDGIDTAGKTIQALWKQRQLVWYWSGFYWYCSAQFMAGPTGCGDSKDQAFLNYKDLLK